MSLSVHSFASPSFRIKSRDDADVQWRFVHLNFCACPLLRSQVPGFFPEQWNAADHASWMALFEFPQCEDIPFLLIIRGLARVWTANVHSGALSLFGSQKRSSSSTEGFWLEMEDEEKEFVEKDRSIHALKRILSWTESKEGGFEASLTLETLLQWWQFGLSCHLLRPVLTKPWPEDFATLMTTRPSSKPVVFSRRAIMFHDEELNVLYCCGPSLTESSSSGSNAWALIPETIVPLDRELTQIRVGGGFESASIASIGSRTVGIHYRLAPSEPPKSLCIAFQNGPENFLAEVEKLLK